MIKDNQTASGGGLTLLGGVFLVFLTLRLAGVIYWSWWWVTAPLWGPFAALLCLCVGMLVVSLIAMAVRCALGRRP